MNSIISEGQHEEWMRVQGIVEGKRVVVSDMNQEKKAQKGQSKEGQIEGMRMRSQAIGVRREDQRSVEINRILEEVKGLVRNK